MELILRLNTSVQSNQPIQAQTHKLYFSSLNMMSYIFLAAIAALLGPLICNCQNFEFYENENYQGYIPFFKAPEQGGWPEGPDNCFTLPPYAHRTVSSVRTNGNCIIIYTEARCTGRSFKIAVDLPSISALKDEATHDDFDNLAMSIRLCDDGKSQEGSSSTVNVALYSDINYQSVIQQHSNLCKCVTLPSSFQPKSIDNHHNCIRLFTSDKCDLEEGITLDLFPGRSSVSEDLTSQPIHGRIASFRPCDSPPACFKLAAEVYRFAVTGDENAKRILESHSNFLSMSARTVITNNGSANVVMEYAARKEVKETTEVQRVTLDRRIESWGRISEKSTAWNIGIDIPEIEGVSISLGLNIANSLQTAYSKTTEEAELNGNRFITETTTEFGVRQLIEVGPCSAYTVDSMVKVVDDFPIYYQMYFTLRGEHANKRMRADELKQEIGSMKEYTYNHTVDEFTVTVFTTAAITASFGVETEIQGEGQRISGCYT